MSGAAVMACLELGNATMELRTHRAPLPSGLQGPKSRESLRIVYPGVLTARDEITLTGRYGSVPTTMTVILLQEYGSTNGRSIRDTNWRCIRYFQPARVHTFAEASRYKWEVYRNTFQKHRLWSGVEVTQQCEN